jgi:hypothetical protein
MKRVDLVKKVNSSKNDDVHFVWEESSSSYVSQTKQPLSEAEAKKITKNEATKILFIPREE